MAETIITAPRMNSILRRLGLRDTSLTDATMKFIADIISLEDRVAEVTGKKLKLEKDDEEDDKKKGGPATSTAASPAVVNENKDDLPL